MAIFRVNKTNDYTIMSNYHFKNKEMSLKAKGLLSLMLSLPDEWDYSVAGLVEITSDGKAGITSALKELEKFNHLKRVAIRKDNKIVDWEYLIYEKPLTDFLQVEKQDVGNQPQLNTKELNTKNIVYSTDKNSFKKPTLDEVKNYCIERNNGIDYQKWFNYYTANGWKVGKNPMKDWKAAVRTWENNNDNKAKESEVSPYGVYLN